MIREEFEKEFGKIPCVKIVGKFVNSSEIPMYKVLCVYFAELKLALASNIVTFSFWGIIKKIFLYSFVGAITFLILKFLNF